MRYRQKGINPHWSINFRKKWMAAIPTTKEMPTPSRQWPSSNWVLASNKSLDLNSIPAQIMGIPKRKLKLAAYRRGSLR